MSRAKAKGVNVTSFFDLKAEISKQEEEFAKSKVSGKNNYVVGGIKRPDKVSCPASLLVTKFYLTFCMNRNQPSGPVRTKGCSLELPMMLNSKQ
jgi:hypothetical protein